MTMQNTSMLVIDAGGGRQKYAISDAQGQPTLLYNTDGEPFTPSVVHFAREGGVLVGTEAAHAGLEDPDRTVSVWKPHLGTDKVLCEPDGRRYVARDILEHLLEYARKCFEAKIGRPPEDVAISHPADATDALKDDILEAARAAGLSVLKLVPEPTAAALGNDLHKRGVARAAIYDLGASTFDVSLLEIHGSRDTVVRTGGIARLGGRDFNDRLLERVLRRCEGDHGFRPDPDQHALFFQEAEGRIEQAKRTLSARPEARVALSCDGKVVNLTVTREQFEKDTADLTARTMDCVAATLDEAGWRSEDLDEILAVGGASRMPAIGEEIEKRFGQAPAGGVEPDYAAAYGNVIACRLERERQGRPLISGGVALPSLDRAYQDVTGQPVGVSVLTRDDERLVNSVILDKGMAIPSEQTRVFSLVQANQTDVVVELLQGPDALAREQCAALGHFELTDLPPQEATDGRIEIRMHIDANGMLSATARDLVSGKTADMTIDYGTNNAGAEDSA